MGKTLSGKFRPRNPDKYKGDPSNICYRSSWELKFMQWLDDREQVLSWSSEEKCVWYYDPVAKKKRRYFPDFIIKFKRHDGIIVEEVVEIKPQKQVDGPPINPKRKTQQWIRQVHMYVTNRAKWEAAATWAEDQGMNFRLLTEKQVKAWSGNPFGR